jgi:hypoxanthine phosphoribosyltransferase
MTKQISMEVVVPRQKLFHKCVALGKAIGEDYGDDPFTIVYIRDGATIFVADLIRQIKARKLKITSLTARSYKGTESTGKVKIISAGLKTKAIRGRRVLLVDDILDTGRTLATVSEFIRTLAPLELKTCVLLRKPSRQIEPIEPDYIGFDLPDAFVVGYGLDYRDRFRELRYIAVLDEKAKRKVDQGW